MKAEKVATIYLNDLKPESLEALAKELNVKSSELDLEKVLTVIPLNKDTSVTAKAK